ncbi:efflux RND transporter permease subunit [Sphingomonas zeae]
MMRFVIVLAAAAGLFAYWSLGRQEDPDYTIRNMLVSAAWPGASASEMADQVAEPIERAIQTLPEVDYIRTNVQPGRTVLNIRVRDGVPAGTIPEIWTKIRQRVADRSGELPDGLRGPRFNDSFGDTYGNIYALTGKGYTLPQLKSFADRLRGRLRALPDVGRVEFQGEPEERIYVEYNSAKLASLGIDPRAIAQTFQDTNAVAPAGTVDVGSERVRIAVTGSFDSTDAIRGLSISTGERSFRLGDVATVTRELADPATFRMRFDGQDAVGVMVSLRKGGNVTRLGEQADEVVRAFQADLPVGVQVNTVANQPHVVEESIGEFTRSLAEAVVIVLAVSFLSLGWRPGIVVALSIPIVLALTFATMLALGIPLHRVSLGALIIALGLLVDDAIIVVEQVEAHLQSGWERVKAVTSAYLITAQPMLIGTLITMLGFLPIQLATSAAGEYARAIFEVVAISLGFSWIVAVFVTPFLANRILPQKQHSADTGQGGHGGHDEIYDGRFYTGLRSALRIALARRRLVIVATILMFLGALGLFAVGVPKQFFPSSDRPELIVDLRAAQNASFEQTMKVATRMERALVRDQDVASVTSYVGGGAPRFYLSLDVQTPSIALAQLVVYTKGGDARERVRERIEDQLARRFPEVRGRVSTLELGPPVGQPFKIRVSGETFDTIAPVAAKVEAMMRASAHLRDVNLDYGEPIKTVRVELDQDKARVLGVTTLAVTRSLQGALEGAPLTSYREGDKVIPVIARLDPSERNSLDRLSQAKVPTATGQPVPISQVARLVPAFEPAELNRRSGLPTITLQADVVDAQPADVAAELADGLQDLRTRSGDRASITLGGIIEESALSRGSVFSRVPVALLLILLLLMVQLQSVKKMLLIVSTGPLALIGVALILSIFRIPFGFVAMLGGLSLFGMVIRNSVILVSQIDALTDEGLSAYEAVLEAAVHRFRPIILTALAAILAMIPLTRSIFWGPMAWAIMGGLIVATLLTLVFLPALYAAAYRIRPETEPARA